LYNIELVRQLCRDINDAKDNPQKEEELLDLLHAVIKENQEEVRIRMAFLAMKYVNAVSDAKAAALRPGFCRASLHPPIHEA